jgi:hypothetical protein
MELVTTILITIGGIMALIGLSVGNLFLLEGINKVTKSIPFTIIVYIILWGAIVGTGAHIASAQTVQTTVTVEIVDEVSSGPIGMTASVRCNNDNFASSTRCSESPVDSFYAIDVAHFEGTLLSGVAFEQFPITSTLSKFVIEDAFWYIDAKGDFKARNDLFAKLEHFVRTYVTRN